MIDKANQPVGGKLPITEALLRIQIRMFLGLLAPDPLVRGTDPSIIMQK
jgi:hypothetical protein